MSTLNHGTFCIIVLGHSWHCHLVLLNLTQLACNHLYVFVCFVEQWVKEFHLSVHITILTLRLLLYLWLHSLLDERFLTMDVRNHRLSRVVGLPRPVWVLCRRLPPLFLDGALSIEEQLQVTVLINQLSFGLGRQPLLDGSSLLIFGRKETGLWAVCRVVTLNDLCICKLCKCFVTGNALLVISTLIVFHKSLRALQVRPAIAWVASRYGGFYKPGRLLELWRAKVV